MNEKKNYVVMVKVGKEKVFVEKFMKMVRGCGLECKVGKMSYDVFIGGYVFVEMNYSIEIKNILNGISESKGLVSFGGEIACVN